MQQCAHILHSAKKFTRHRSAIVRTRSTKVCVRVCVCMGGFSLSLSLSFSLCHALLFVIGCSFAGRRKAPAKNPAVMLTHTTHTPIAHKQSHTDARMQSTTSHSVLCSSAISSVQATQSRPLILESHRDTGTPHAFSGQQTLILLRCTTSSIVRNLPIALRTLCTHTMHTQTHAMHAHVYAHAVRVGSATGTCTDVADHAVDLMWRYVVGLYRRLTFLRCIVWRARVCVCYVRVTDGPRIDA
jgi:hypothetical protein